MKILYFKKGTYINEYQIDLSLYQMYINRLIIISYGYRLKTVCVRTIFSNREHLLELSLSKSPFFNKFFKYDYVESFFFKEN